MLKFCCCCCYCVYLVVNVVALVVPVLLADGMLQLLLLLLLWWSFLFMAFQGLEFLWMLWHWGPRQNGRMKHIQLLKLFCCCCCCCCCCCVCCCFYLFCCHYCGSCFNCSSGIWFVVVIVAVVVVVFSFYGILGIKVLVDVVALGPSVERPHEAHTAMLPKNPTTTNQHLLISLGLEFNKMICQEIKKEIFREIGRDLSCD